MPGRCSIQLSRAQKVCQALPFFYDVLFEIAMDFLVIISASYRSATLQVDQSHRLTRR